MTNQIELNYRKVLFIVILFISTNLRSQCAGTDNTVTVCDKDQDLTTRNYDLFSQLGGSPIVGGIWTTTNPANFFALNSATGEVDLWRINNNGVHEFIYNNICGDSATVTINLGGYSGEDNIDGSANACSDNSMVNLHGFLGSEIDGKVQDFNGLWEEDPGSVTGFLNDNIFDAFSAGPGVYTFTYTVSAVATCASSQSTVVLEVHPSPAPGTPISLEVCTNEDLSSYTNFDLNSLLVGEDTNGTWSEFGTNQLGDLTDHEININEINQNSGYGTYNFRYTVYPTHPVCSESFTEVQILISPVLEGSLESSVFCSGLPLDVLLNYNNTILPNGEYTIEYTITDNVGTQTGFSDVVLSTGQGTIPVDPLLVTPNEFVQLNIVGISGINPTRSVCDATNVIASSILASNASAIAVDICPSTDATVELTNILDALGTLTNAQHTITYDLTDPQGNTNSYVAQAISFINGSGNLELSASQLIEPGPYFIDIEIQGSLIQDCLIADFTVNEAPEDIALNLIVDNNCDATQIDVLVDAPILSTGIYTVTYEVTQLNTTTVLVSNTIAFNGGTADYQIDLSSLTTGDYTVTLRSEQDDTTLCRTTFNFEESENFAIGRTTDLPQVTTNQVFCENDFPVAGPTLANVNVISDDTISFYADAASNSSLPLNTLIVDGQSYYVSSMDPDNNCSSSERVMINVSIIAPDTPISSNTTPFYCSAENAQILDLQVSSISGQPIVWYNQASGGTIINATELLVDGQSYFATETINGSCESAVRLEFIPTIQHVQTIQLNSNTLSVCGMDSPTVADLYSLVENSSPEMDWFDSLDGIDPLLNSDLLQEGTTYYLENFDADTGCINPNRTAVSLDLTNCNPDDYGFFVPDGFSPNGDGRNDNFYVPNIDAIFPHFTLEVLNRYGSRLFKGDKNNPSWDGDKAPNGVYFYIIDFNKEGFAPKQGRLYLNR